MLKTICVAMIAAAVGGFSAFAQSSSPRGTLMVQAAPADVLKDLAPAGKIRASINLGNMVLAQKDPSGALKGVSVDLARELGKRLNVPVELVPFDAAGKAFEGLTAGKIDVVFLAIEPVRAKEVAFTAPYVLIEGVYMVPQGSKLKTVADVDVEGIRIGVNTNSAYDLFLTRSLKHAKLVRGDDGIALFVNDKLDAAAGVKQPLVEYAKSHPEVKIMDGRFMEIQQAMGTVQGRDAGAKYLRTFVEEMKASGFVADALKRSNQPDAAVAPPAK
jgi:polar amino acid transport system substrate-binding protein